MTTRARRFLGAGVLEGRIKRGWGCRDLTARERPAEPTSSAGHQGSPSAVRLGGGTIAAAEAVFLQFVQGLFSLFPGQLSNELKQVGFLF